MPPVTRSPCLLQLDGLSMGTSWSVRAVSPLPAQCLQSELDAALANIVMQMSHWQADSVLSRFNRATPGWYRVPQAFFEVITCALHVARSSAGAYDPTIGELVQLWGFGAKHKHSTDAQPPAPPGRRRIAAARSRSGWQKLHLNAEHRGVWQPGGLVLDFSAIAKGYGVDTMAQILTRHGIAHYLVELGGELRAAGQRPDGQAWRLHIETPDAGPDTQPALPIVLNNAAIATSGDYRRYFLHGKRRYAHTLDPRSGWAVHNDLASVSVIHPQCMHADAWSTALLCLGWQDGLAFARQHGMAALFMRRCHDLSGPSNALEFAWTDEFYRLAHPDREA